MEQEQLPTIDDEALDEVSGGGPFGLGLLAGAVFGGIVVGTSLIGIGVGMAIGKTMGMFGSKS